MVTTIATNPGSPSVGDDQGWADQDSFCITVELPPEYASIGPALTHRRRQDAEAGPAHRTARKLGRLFEDILPSTPLLIKTYGKRAAQIMNTPGANPTASTQSHGPFAEFMGADATAVWAAATSGDAAIAVHLLACMIARAFEDPVVATNLWIQIIALRFAEVLKLTPPKLPDSFDWASRWPSDKFFTLEEVRQLDASTRHWLRTADEAMAEEHSRFHTACVSLVRAPIFPSSDNDKSTYVKVKEDWFMALNMMENLLKGDSIPEDAIGSAGFIAMSAWHLYPPLTTADTASMTVNTFRTTDELMKTTIAQSITFIDPSRQGTERNICWPLDRTAATDTLVGTVNERLSIADLHLVSFGSLLRVWSIRQDDSARDAVAVWMVALWDCVDKVMQRQARPEWLRLLASAATRLLSTSGTERDHCTRLICLGYRQGHLFLGVPSGKAALPWFGLRSPHILAALSQESPAECAIEYLRQLCLYSELGPDDALITWISPTSKGISTHLYTSAVPRKHVEYRLATAAGGQVPNKLPDLQPDLKTRHDKGKGRYVDEETMEEVVSFKHSRWLGQSSVDGTRLLELDTKKHRDNSYESSMRRKISNFTANVNRGYSDLEASERSSRYDNDYFTSHDRPSFDTPGSAASAKSKEEGAYPLTSLIAISGLFSGEYKLERGSGILTSASGSIPRGLDSWGHRSGPLAFSKMLNSSQEFFRLWLAPLASDKISRFEERVNSLRKGDLASLVPWEESVARLKSGINSSLLLQFFEGSDPFDPSDFAKPVLELMETERNSVNELLRPLRNLAFATSIYKDLGGASISSRIVTTGLADPAWGDAETSPTPTRSQIFGCIAMMESGVIDLKLEHIEQVFGLSSGTSLFVLSRLISDPGLQHQVSKTAVARLVGNVGRPGITLLTTAQPESPSSLLDHPDKWNDSFSAASLQLSLTQEEPAFSYTVYSDLRPNISLLEGFFSFQDRAGWITHVDILAALDNGLIPTMPRPSAKCDGSCEQNRPELVKEMQERTKEVDSWEQWDNELQEGKRQVVFWKTAGNSAARLALAAYMVSLGTGKKKAAIKDYAVLENEGTDCRVCIYRRVKQYVKKHGRQGPKVSGFWVIE